MKLLSEYQQQQEEAELWCSTLPVKQQPEQQDLRMNRPKKTVSFSANVQINTIMPYQDYTEDEMQTIWYQKKDYKAFKRIILTTLQLNRAGELPEGGNDEHTMRGIECRTREGAAARKATKEQVMAAVLGEQARQRQDKQLEQQKAVWLLARVSRQLTEESQLEASIHGMCDELEARLHTSYNTVVQSISAATRMHQKMSEPRRTIRLPEVDLQAGWRLVAGSAA